MMLCYAGANQQKVNPSQASPLDNRGRKVSTQLCSKKAKSKPKPSSMDGHRRSTAVIRIVPFLRSFVERVHSLRGGDSLAVPNNSNNTGVSMDDAGMPEKKE
jgi:hypothetical protein